jgi:hypothetical protein
MSYDLLARPRAAEPAAEPAQGTQGDIVGHRADERDRKPAATGSGGRRRQRERPR